MDKVCVLILNYRTWRETIRYVAHLRTQRGVDLSVLLVDNCSPNGSYRELADHFRDDPAVTVIQTPRNGGYAYGNNYGLRYLAERDVDFVLISNNDIRLDDDFLLQKMTAAYRRLPDAAFLAPKMYVNGQEDQKHQAFRRPAFRHDLFFSLRALYALAHLLGLTNRYHFSKDNRRTEPVDCLSGCFFLGAKARFCELGLFDENTFLYGEEAILGEKAHRRGLRSYLLRSARFHHEVGHTIDSLHTVVQRQRYWLASTVYFHRRYRGAGWLKVGMLRLFFWLWRVETVVWGWVMERG